MRHDGSPCPRQPRVLYSPRIGVSAKRKIGLPKKSDLSSFRTRLATNRGAATPRWELLAPLTGASSKLLRGNLSRHRSLLLRGLHIAATAAAAAIAAVATIAAAVAATVATAMAT